tara:strand:- start:322 stop:3168 length:2847 start_codon:yes stop_codon:yes gene_type:complete
MLISKIVKTKEKFKNHTFSGLSFDSDLCKKNYIFFAIKGNISDGHRYIKSAIKNGARTIIHQKRFEGFKKNVLFLNYKNTRKILSQISFQLYGKKPNNIIAVTGTNGKSSVSDFYLQILKLNNVKAASIGTLGVNFLNRKIPAYNTTLDSITLSKYLSFLKKKKINNVILEASSHGLKQNRLDGLNISCAVFTNFSHDHLDYHKNLKDYLKSKLYLFNTLLKKKSTIITDRSIKEFNTIKQIAIKKNLKLKTISSKKSNIQLISLKYKGERQIITIKFQKKLHNFTLNLIGRTQVKNVLMAMLAAKNSKISFKKIINNIHKLKPVNGRFEKIGKIKNNSTVILDYAHTPDALRTCLSDIKNQFSEKKIKIVFGCGGDRDKYKRSKMGVIANSYCSKIYLTDDNPRNESPKKIRSDIKKNISSKKLIEISDRQQAIFKAIEDLQSSEILVVAGKGHEVTQDYGNKKKYFSDKDCIKKFIQKKNKKISNNIKKTILEEYFQKQIFNKLKIGKASINSKTIQKNQIFFAIKGKKKDGNLFVKNAFDNGARIAIVNKYCKNSIKARQIKVSDTLKCLTDISMKIRENFQGKLIAITGSCGKTSLKHLIGESINKFNKTSFSPKSYNNKFGVPLSLFNLNLNYSSGIFEIGMDKKGEIDNLSKILRPDIGIITNISYAHAKNFKNLSEIAAAKGELIQNIKKDGVIILNKDDNFFSIHKKQAFKRGLKVISFGLKKSADIKLCSTKKNKSNYKVSIKIFKNKNFFYLKKINKNNIYNILATISVIYSIGFYKNLMSNLFNDSSVPEGRGDISIIKLNKKKIYLIDESYNSNPLSMKSAIKNFDLIKIKNNKKHLLMGDMLELGNFSKKLHIELGKEINNSSIDKFHIIGKLVKHTYKYTQNIKKGYILNKHNQIYDLIANKLNNNDYLMIKGSNSTGLNKYVSSLKEKRNYAL